MTATPEKIKQFSKNILDFLNRGDIHSSESLQDRLGKYDQEDGAIIIERSYMNGSFDVSYYDSQGNCPIRIRFNNGREAEIIVRSQGTILGYTPSNPEFKDLIKIKKTEMEISKIKKELEKLCQK